MSSTPQSIPLTRRIQGGLAAAVGVLVAIAVAVTLIAVSGTNNPAQRTVKPNPKSVTPTLSSTLASLSPQERQYALAIAGLSPLAAGYGTSPAAAVGKAASSPQTATRHPGVVPGSTVTSYPGLVPGSTVTSYPGLVPETGKPTAQSGETRAAILGGQNHAGGASGLTAIRPPVVGTTAGGFDWGDGAIGALVVLGVTAAGFGAIALVRRRRSNSLARAVS